MRLELYLKNLLMFFVSTAIVACNTQQKNESEVATEQAKVYSVGKLMDIMYQGKVEANVKLDTLSKEHLYGLGAIEALKGEVTIINGQVYQAKVDSLGPDISINDSLKATLLVYSYVERWDSITVSGVKNIDSLIAVQLNENGLKEPVPFMILGEPKQLNYHIINFLGDKPNRENHKNGALVGGIANEPLHILGFYAKDAAGVYTHMNSNLHMHFVTDDQSKSGHIESLDVQGKSIKLLLPEL